MGFSDARLAELTGMDEAAVSAHRRSLKVRPVFKRVDTCAAEFASHTPYMYSTYEFGPGAECEAQPEDRTKVIILGGGPNRRSEEHKSELQSLMRISYAVFCLTKTPEAGHTHYSTTY